MREIGVPLAQSLFSPTGTVTPSGQQQITLLFAIVLQLQQGYIQRITQQTNYNASPSDVMIAYAVLPTPVTVTLPVAVTALAGHSFIVVDESGVASANHITVVSGGTIGVISHNYGSLWCYCTGTTYRLLPSNL